jgi:hypothetical protein
MIEHLEDGLAQHLDGDAFPCCDEEGDLVPGYQSAMDLVMARNAQCGDVESMIDSAAATHSSSVEMVWLNTLALAAPFTRSLATEMVKQFLVDEFHEVLPQPSPSPEPSPEP